MGKSLDPSRVFHEFEPDYGPGCKVCGVDRDAHPKKTKLKDPMVKINDVQCRCCCVKRRSSEIALEWSFYGFILGALLTSVLYSVNI